MATISIIRPTNLRTPSVIQLSPVDQLMQTQRTIFAFCFPLDSDADSWHIFHQLRESLIVTISQIPILAGRVVLQDPTRMELAIALDEEAGAQFEYQDHRASIKLDFSQLHASVYPFHLLDRKTFYPAGLSVPQVIGHRCFIAKLNVISGGLLLFTSFSHPACDASGMDIFLRRWAENCKEKTGATDTVTTIVPLPDQDLYRSSLVKPRASFNPKEFTRKTRLIPPGQNPTSKPDNKSAEEQRMPKESFTSGLWCISSTCLEELKANSQSPVAKDACVSTLDVVTSLLLRYILLASGTQPDDSTTVNIGIIRNLRGLLTPPIRGEFIGNAAFPTIFQVPTTDVLAVNETSACRKTSSQIRGELKRWDSGIQGVLDELSTLPSFTGLVPILGQDGLMISDLSKLTSPWADWGKVMKVATSFRYLRPNRQTVWARTVFLPRKIGKDLEILVEVPRSTHIRLIEDKNFSKHFNLMFDSGPSS